jgi:outer membrane protein assembly factor BamD
VIRGERALGVCSLVLGLALAGCSGKKQPKTDPAVGTPRQVYENGMQLLQKGKGVEARETLESIQLQFAGEDREWLQPLIRLGIADATFYEGHGINLIDAKQLYLDFVTLYGDHPLAPYALFQSGVCSLLEANAPANDQSQTHAAYDDLHAVLRRYPDSPFALAARDKIHETKSRLAEHEFLVGQFYMKRKAFIAAIERFRGILDRFPEYDELDKVYYYLGQSLLKVDNFAEGRIYMDKLVEEYPDGRYFRQARRALGTTDDSLQATVDGSPN